MRDLPRGTVTLVFTDVEGSTKLQRHLGERYHEVVEAHRRLLETAFDAHGGRIVDRQRHDPSKWSSTSHRRR